MELSFEWIRLEFNIYCDYIYVICYIYVIAAEGVAVVGMVVGNDGGGYDGESGVNDGGNSDDLSKMWCWQY